MTSKDLLRAIRIPLEDITKEIVKQIEGMSGQKGYIVSADEGYTLIIKLSDGDYGLVSIGLSEPPLAPMVTIMMNNALYGRVGDEFKGLFRHHSASHSRTGTVLTVRFGAEAADWREDSQPYHPLRKYRGATGKAAGV